MRAPIDSAPSIRSVWGVWQRKREPRIGTLREVWVPSQVASRRRLGSSTVRRPAWRGRFRDQQICAVVGLTLV